MKADNILFWSLAACSVVATGAQAQVKVDVNPFSRRMVTVETPGRSVEVQPTRGKVNVAPKEANAAPGPTLTEVTTDGGPAIILPQNEEVLVDVPAGSDASAESTASVVVHKMSESPTDSSATPVPPPRTQSPMMSPQPMSPSPALSQPQAVPPSAVLTPYSYPEARIQTYPAAPPPTVMLRPQPVVVPAPVMSAPPMPAPPVMPAVPVTTRGRKPCGPMKSFPVRHPYSGLTFFVEIPCLPIEDIDHGRRSLEIEFDDGEVEIDFHRDGSATVEYDF